MFNINKHTNYKEIHNVKKVILRMAIFPEVQKQAQKNSFGSSKRPDFYDSCVTAFVKGD